MLMTALAAGRGISLRHCPPRARPMPRAPLAPMPGYASSQRRDRKIRRHRGALARIAGTAYLLDAARRLTAPRSIRAMMPARRQARSSAFSSLTKTFLPPMM